MRKVTNIVVAGLGGQGVLKGTDIPVSIDGRTPPGSCSVWAR